MDCRSRTGGHFGLIKPSLSPSGMGCATANLAMVAPRSCFLMRPVSGSGNPICPSRTGWLVSLTDWKEHP